MAGAEAKDRYVQGTESPDFMKYGNRLNITSNFDKTTTIKFNDLSLNLNVKPNQVQLLHKILTEMIIRGVAQLKQQQLKNNVAPYEGDHGNVDMKNGYVFDTTIMTSDLIGKIFKFSTGKTPVELEREGNVIAAMVANFINDICKQETQKN